MISFDGDKLRMEGSGLDLLSELSFIISKLVSEFNCPAGLLLLAVKIGIAKGKEHKSETDDDSFTVASSEPFSEELLKKLRDCETASEAKEIYKQFTESADKKEDTVKQEMFKKMFGDLMNE